MNHFFRAWIILPSVLHSDQCFQMWPSSLVLYSVTHFWRCYQFLQIKTESTRRWSNKWTETLYQDYLNCIANFYRAVLIIFSKQFISSNTERRKRMLNFVWNTWKFWWNETDDEILSVFPQNHWTLKFIFSLFHGKLFFGVISGNYLCI